jgi:hypothetical protein
MCNAGGNLVLSMFVCAFVLSEAVYPVSDARGLGLRFDGVGALSGGGGTSVYLRDYPDAQQSLLLDLLFKPGYGASLHILKVEIGGDSQSTEAVEPSHMHTETDLNMERGYEGWLLAQAKARNPAIKTCTCSATLASAPFLLVLPRDLARRVCRWPCVGVSELGWQRYGLALRRACPVNQVPRELGARYRQHLGRSE